MLQKTINRDGKHPPMHQQSQKYLKLCTVIPLYFWCHLTPSSSQSIFQMSFLRPSTSGFSFTLCKDLWPVFKIVSWFWSSLSKTETTSFCTKTDLHVHGAKKLPEPTAQASFRKIASIKAKSPNALSIEVCTYNPSTWEAEVRSSQVWRQPGLRNKKPVLINKNKCTGHILYLLNQKFWERRLQPVS